VWQHYSNTVSIVEGSKSLHDIVSITTDWLIRRCISCIYAIDAFQFYLVISIVLCTVQYIHIGITTSTPRSNMPPISLLCTRWPPLPSTLPSWEPPDSASHGIASSFTKRWKLFFMHLERFHTHEEIQASLPVCFRGVRCARCRSYRTGGSRIFFARENASIQLLSRWMMMMQSQSLLWYHDSSLILIIHT